MLENNVLQALINGVQLEGNSFNEISYFLSSNKIYKYTPTYLTDSQKEYNVFCKNIPNLKPLIRDAYKYLLSLIKKLDTPIFYNYSVELKINNAVQISSKNDENIEIINDNDDKLLNFLCQSDIYSHYLTLKYRYSIFNSFTEAAAENAYEYEVEHTYEIKDKKDIHPNINRFINIVALDLCAKANYTSK